MNWYDLIAALLQHPITNSEAKIAKLVGVNQPRINRLKTGYTKEPPHSLGEKLIKLHRDVCGHCDDVA